MASAVPNPRMTVTVAGVAPVPMPEAIWERARTGRSRTPALSSGSGQPVEVVRCIRDDIDTQVQQLLSELVPPGPRRLQRHKQRYSDLLRMSQQWPA
jgi:hypothetical protein